MKRILGLLVALTLIAACGPEGDSDGSASISPTPTPTSTAAPVSFQNDVVPIFYASCGAGLTGCHDAEPFNANFNWDCRGWLSLEDSMIGSVYNSGPNLGEATGCEDFDLYTRLLAIGAWTCGPVPNNPGAGGGTVKSFVVPSDPDNSYLLQRITGQADPCNLPPNAQAMPPVGTMAQAEIDTIRNWIEQGALDN